ncbi:hypothetical protein D3C71_1713600 [compost metagenome]
MAAELPFFPFARRHVVFHEGIPEQVAGSLGFTQALRGFPQGRGQAQMRGKLLGIGVALHHRFGLEALFDSMQAGSQGGGQRKIGIGVGRADAHFDALRLVAARNEAQRRRAVLHAPGGVQRRPIPRHQPRIAVDGLRIERHEFRQIALHARHE